ncbi:hypothetical protein [Psychrobacillus sp. NPDC093180]|uniref:hypothetical protein n=1 Tax=Psychrobacillus sp. NPDC093180 TaxID=3364489 RepID=UPI00382122FA
MRELKQTDTEQNTSIQAITDATTKPIRNWVVSFIGTVSIIAICLLTFYLVTMESNPPVTSSSENQSINKVYYFTNGNRDEHTFFEKWSPFYLHVGVMNDSKMLEQFQSFLQDMIPRSKDDYYNSWYGNDFSAMDILIMYNDGSERRLKELSSSFFLDMKTDELFYIPSDNWLDFSREFFKNPNADWGKIIGILLLFFAPFSMTLWFKRKFPIIKYREWSLNWTHHLLNYLAIVTILVGFSYWENNYGTFHIVVYATIWLIYGACQVVYRLKKDEHMRSIQLTIINHLIGTVALVLCVFGF